MMELTANHFLKSEKKCFKDATPFNHLVFMLQNPPSETIVII